MLTRHGWSVACGAVGLVVAGRLLGIYELFLVGAGCAALVVVSAVTVGMRKLRLDISRDLHPRRVHAGSGSKVELRVRNIGRRRTPLLALRDPVGPSQTAKVLLAPLGTGASVQAAYRLPTERRGILRVGPLDVQITDPFGLAALSTPGAPATDLTIYPAIDAIPALPHTQGDDPHGGADHPNALSSSGEDFYALREYQIGDDLRRVHWRATARHDELMVRQDEMPWQGRATVLLDVRRTAHTDATLERAVSAAASIVVACRQRKFLVRVVASDGSDSGFAGDASHLDAIMERLATIEPSDSARFPGILATLGRSAGAGSLVAVLGGRARGDAEVLERLRRSFGTLTTVVFVSGRDRDQLSVPARTIVVDDDASFPEAWSRALGQLKGGAAMRVPR